MSFTTESCPVCCPLSLHPAPLAKEKQNKNFTLRIKSLRKNKNTKYRLLTQGRTKCSKKYVFHFCALLLSFILLYFHQPGCTLSPRITSNLQEHPNFHRVPNQPKICYRVNRNSSTHAIKADISQERDSAVLPAGTQRENSSLVIDVLIRAERNVPWNTILEPAISEDVAESCSGWERKTEKKGFSVSKCIVLRSIFSLFWFLPTGCRVRWHRIKKSCCPY